MTPSPLGAYNDREIEKRCRSTWPQAQEADGRGRLRRRLRGHSSTARTTATSTTRRSASRWPACGRSSKVKVKVNGDAARDLLPEAREVRHQHVHARLGRRGHRRRDDADAGAAQPPARRASAPTTTAARRTTSSMSWPRSRASRPTRRSARSWSRRRCASTRSRSHTHPAAPPGDPLGGARNVDGRAPRRQLVRGRVGDDRQVGRGLSSAKRCGCPEQVRRSRVKARSGRRSTSGEGRRLDAQNL